MFFLKSAKINYKLVIKVILSIKSTKNGHRFWWPPTTLISFLYFSRAVPNNFGEHLQTARLIATIINLCFKNREDNTPPRESTTIELQGILKKFNKIRMHRAEHVLTQHKMMYL